MLIDAMLALTTVVNYIIVVLTIPVFVAILTIIAKEII